MPNQLPNIITLDAITHRDFLAEKRKDPVVKTLISAGDRVVVCAHCKLVFLETTWDFIKEDHGRQTLDRIPQKERPPEILYFRSDKDFLDDGKPLRLSWKVIGKVVEFKILIRSLSTGKTSSQGVKLLENIEFSPREDTEYVLYVKNFLFPAQQESIIVRVSKEPPVIHNFDASTLFVKDKKPLLISWNVDNYEKLYIYSDYKEIEVTGNENKRISFFPRKDTAYVLRAVSYYGVFIERKIEIEVDKTAPHILFSSQDKILMEGFGTQLFWNVKGAEVITIDNDLGSVGAKGSRYIEPQMSGTYTLKATTYFGYSASKSIKIEVINIPKPSEFLTPTPQLTLVDPNYYLNSTIQSHDLAREILEMPDIELVPLLDFE